MGIDTGNYKSAIYPERPCPICNGTGVTPETRAAVKAAREAMNG